MDAFKEPHGRELKDLYLDPTAAEAEKPAAHRILVKFESMGFIQ